jgi:hypothetical protein
VRIHTQSSPPWVDQILICPVSRGIAECMWPNGLGRDVADITDLVHRSRVTQISCCEFSSAGPGVCEFGSVFDASLGAARFHPVVVDPVSATVTGEMVTTAGLCVVQPVVQNHPRGKADHLFAGRPHRGGETQCTATQRLRNRRHSRVPSCPATCLPIRRFDPRSVAGTAHPSHNEPPVALV